MIFYSREKRSLTNRHIVLKALFYQSDADPGIVISSNKLHKLTNLKITEIEKQGELLIGAGEVTTTSEGELIYFTLTEDGRRAFLDEKYLKLASHTVKQGVEFLIRIIIPIAALIISIISLVNSCNNRQINTSKNQTLNSKK
jgi:hypothetical protein